MLAQTVLRWAVVIGADRDDPGEIIAVEPAQHLQRLGRRIAADPDKHRQAPGDNAEHAFDERLAFVVVEGRAFARRAEREDAADPGGDVMLDQLLVADEIDDAAMEWRHNRQPHAG